jgi:phosphoribosylformylglycinamidine synthase
VLDDVTRRVPQGFQGAGQELWLLGSTRDELSGSEWAHVVHGHLGGRPPAVDLAAEAALGELLRQAAADGILDAAHDVSDGGLAVTLAEACLRHDVGARIALPGRLDPFVELHAESTARSVVAVPAGEQGRLVDAATAHGVPHVRLGVTEAGGPGAALEVEGLFVVSLGELRAAWSATLPAALEG